MCQHEKEKLPEKKEDERQIKKVSPDNDTKTLKDERVIELYDPSED